ncbi:ubiquinol-cytochrome c reductase core subunit 1 [Scheffersomyces stipitis CBS 6054]|uniref:Ubiquinol-cytochrome c reductase core subunit 1 n=1 Tax=Scheffersomyces stipitis (strain ATCC 58785 / CBS 6054 / NBRC 10063 / NRRL Y-11545) TaxID=322104 RepID=A3LQM4_PICST|nr:ubiquinol-cytochrome c reductase core subunit 1 [Scheffersomyces stipitis CBS 6054]ABN65227.1 ubiquinol-cytochrome c reductase core subunit 1 [Scheffersomyces stipitis CBS 6054]
MIRGSALRTSAKSLTARRLLSTANGQTKYTTLSNGVTIASETNTNAATATVGLYYGAGSRSEHPYNNGVSALTASILGSGLQDGVLLSSESTKETNGILATTTNANIASAGKLIAQIASNPVQILEKSDFAAAKNKLAAAADAVEADPNAKVLEHLNASAFQGYSLGLPTLGTSESVQDLELQDAVRSLEKHLVASNTVIAAAGNFDHEALVAAVEANLTLTQGLKPQEKPASFLGSEVRMRDDTLPKAYVAIAAQGEAFNSPAYYVAKVAAAIFGDFDHHSAFAAYTSPKLASIVQEYHIADKYTHFSTSYSDTGLWGFASEISNIEAIDDFTHFTLKEWNRLSVSISNAEVARGKAAVKTALLRQLNSTPAVVSDIATKVLLAGYRSSVKEALEKIDAIQTKDVKAWAQATLWDKDIVISGTGQIEDLLDYNRNRNEMAALRW